MRPVILFFTFSIFREKRYIYIYIYIFLFCCFKALYRHATQGAPAGGSRDAPARTPAARSELIPAKRHVGTPYAAKVVVSFVVFIFFCVLLLEVSKNSLMRCSFVEFL